MTALGIMAALGGRRGRCACPSCRDAGRDRGGDHLAVREDAGRVLVHCHAGCGQAEVIAALRARGLWPEPERREFTAAERRAFAQARAAAAEDARRAWRWSVGALERLNEAKRAAIDHESGQMNVRALEAAARAAREIEAAGPGAVMAAWRRGWADEPEQARADEAAGANSERMGVMLAAAVAGLPAGKGAAYGELAA
jgi:hypothetical protein